ncbi:MAG: class I SAM-dependent methyltransferase [Clostridiaceae bacterium]
MNKYDYWKEVWDRKGSSETKDIRTIDGFESTVADLEKIAANISRVMEIKPEDTVLEVGCGAGGVAQYLNCKYVGVDYSEPMIKKHIQLLGNSVLWSEANNLPFKDNSFDKVFIYGISHYFPHHEYADQAFAEMKRVAKKCIFIGDLPAESHREEHLLYKKEDFTGWRIMDPDYNPLRFNAYLEL